MSIKYLTYFLICSSLLFLLPCSYIKIWNFGNKFFKNKFLKAISIGLITPLFSFAFAKASVFSLFFLLCLDGVTTESNNAGGVLTLLLFVYGIPVSILLGIVVIVFILMENTSFRNEFISSLKKDTRGFFQDRHSNKKK